MALLILLSLLSDKALLRDIVEDIHLQQAPRQHADERRNGLASPALICFAFNFVPASSKGEFRAC